MPNAYSKLSVYQLIPAKYISRINLELQRTFMVFISLLKTHRRKAVLLSLGPSTILKFITVILPIIKFMPTLIKAFRTLSQFTRSNNNADNANNNSGNSNRTNALANRDANTAAADGLGMSMDELNEILWTPAEDMYWERVNSMVTKFGLCKTLGISIAGVRPGRVEVVMPFRAEVSGEGGAFHASLLPTLIALTSQLTGMTLLPRYFTLKPIDFKCNILSDCDTSTYLLVARGAVVVRGDHSITVKVEVLKASGSVPGSGDTSAASPTTPGPSLLSWRTWVGSSSSAPSSPSTSIAEKILIPGTGIERRKFAVCASGTQTSVVVRAGTDADDEEDKEMDRLKKEREQRVQSLRRSTSASSSSSSLIFQQQQQEEDDADNEMDESAIILGDSLRVTSTPRPASPTAATKTSSSSRSPSPTSTTVVKPAATTPVTLSPKSSTSCVEFSSPSSSTVLVEPASPVPNNDSDTIVTNGNSKGLNRILSSTSSQSTRTIITSSASSIPMMFGSSMRQDTTDVSDTDQSHQQHSYDATSDTEAWQGR
ncbi:hypothetical protein BG004_006784 [Podila humilis]|nr:hypothetical protein BG004_006784 [Podila humilis]